MKNIILSAMLLFSLATTSIYANVGDDKPKKKEKKAKLHKQCTVADKKACSTSGKCCKGESKVTQ